MGNALSTFSKHSNKNKRSAHSHLGADLSERKSPREQDYGLGLTFKRMGRNRSLRPKSTGEGSPDVSGLFFLIRARLASLRCVANPIQFLRHSYSAKAMYRAVPSSELLSS